jgi:hypothetical protein
MVVVGENLNIKDHLKGLGSLAGCNEVSGSTKYGIVRTQMKNSLLVVWLVACLFSQSDGRSCEVKCIVTSS